ncbi:MAG TPA: hypothetical protein VLF66_16095, partial [Thermoanaerobaculia bacterium]|nr:hypothetical protein [Thermoanaerobaculia bacterium]
FTQREFESWATRHGVELAPVPEVTLSHDPRLARQGCLSDESFFRQLGFERVSACDVSDWEGADVLADLNRPIPAELHGRFDVVFETGTSVQIFDLPQVLDNLHRFLAPGGRVIHAAVPSNNHMDLGFYMVSPTLFADYYEANRYRLEYEYLCVYSPYWHRGRLRTGPWKVYLYTPGCLDHLSYGRYGGLQTAVFAVATKTEGSTGDAIPQLGQYRASWEAYRERSAAGEEAAAGELAAAGEREGPGRRLRDRVERWLDAHPAWAGAYLPVKRARERLRRLLPPKMPPLVAKL